MLQHIKVQNHKGIRSAEIRDLGMITVLAGRNNSGKSSILEAISSAPGPNFTIGITLGDNEIDACVNRFESNIAQFNSPDPRTSIHVFSREINSHKGELLYIDDISQISDSIFNELRTKVGRHDQSTFQVGQSIRAGFAKASETANSVCLIPAKRLLDSSGTMEFAEAQEFSPAGSKIITHLFYLKNQPITSEEYARFLSTREAFMRVTDGLDFNLVPSTDAKIHLYFNDYSGKWYPAKDCGLGLQDMLVITTIVTLSSAKVILIEEPENHIHPDKQRRLLGFLRSQEGRQFVLATHSSVFLDPSYIDKTIFVERGDDGVVLQDRTTRANLLKGLGYAISENIGCDLIVLTEGPNDGPSIEILLKKLGVLEDCLIRFWPLGGDAMSRFDFSLISESYDPSKVIALIDRDPKSKKAREAFKAKCEAAGIQCFQLERYSIENYVSLEAIRNNNQLAAQVSITEILPSKQVDAQLGFSIKKWLPQLFDSMTIDDFHGTDLIEFCNTMVSRAKS